MSTRPGNEKLEKIKLAYKKNFVYPSNSTADLLIAQLSNFSNQNSEARQSSPSKINDGLQKSR